MTIGRELNLPAVGEKLPDFGGHLALELHNLTDGLYVEVLYTWVGTLIYIWVDTLLYTRVGTLY